MVGVVSAMSLFLGSGMGWGNRIQVVVLPVARIARVTWAMYRLMVPLVVLLLRVVTRRVLASLVMPTVRVLSVKPQVLVLFVMISLMARVLLRLPVPLVMTTVRVLQVMVLGVSPRMGARRWYWVGALATPGGGLGGRLWSVGSLVLAVFVASGVWACPRQSSRRVLMERVVKVTVLSMSLTSAVAGVATSYAEGEVGVGDDGAGGWRRCR